MSRPQTITHAYRLPGGWEPVPKQRLSIQNALALRAEGYTMIRAKKRFGKPYNHSMVQFLQAAGHRDT